MHARGKVFEPVDSFADNEPDWGDVDKTKLPRECFVDQGEPDKKSTWRYPCKWVQDGSGSDEDGIYTSGTIRPHRGGINAAWGAANGAHTGKKASPEIIKKLEGLRERYGLTEGKGKDGGQLDFGPAFADSSPPAEAAELRRAGAAELRRAGATADESAGKPGHIHTHEVRAQPPPWDTVDEKSLPDAAFADPEKRLYAHHHVDGATQQDAAGHCSDGKMYLHAAGAKCAFMKAITDGASEGVIQHLATHAFNLAAPEYTAPQGLPAGRVEGVLGSAVAPLLGSGVPPTSAPQFGPGAKRNAECAGSAVAPLLMKGAVDSAIHNPPVESLWVERQSAIRRLQAPQIRYKDAVLAELEAPEVATGAGYIEGYAAIFGNVDSQGEIIHKGAFAKTVRERVPAGKVKLMTLHLSKGGSTLQVVGTVTQAREDDRGLWIHAEFASDPDSQAARAKVAGGHVRSLSIGYYPVSRMETIVDGEVVMELKEIKLLEVTLTPFPANELAEVTSAKSIDLPAGRVAGGNGSQPATGTGSPATADWGSAIARRRLALARLEMEV